jgi:hypothetical protein
MANLGPAAADAGPDLIRLLKSDRDDLVRRNAAVALAKIGKFAEAAVPALAERIGDAAESPEVRSQCAISLGRIGPVPGADAIIPTLLQVLADTKDAPKVRERVCWALRVHGIKLREMKAIHDTFVRVVREAPAKDNKLLHYDCAYMLGMIWQKDAPEEVLDILLEYLRDPDLQIFAGQKSAPAPGQGVEPRIKKNDHIEDLGVGDGRVMALDALKMIGPARYGKRADIMKQLNVLASDNQIHQTVRTKAAELLKAVQAPNP